MKKIIYNAITCIFLVGIFSPVTAQYTQREAKKALDVRSPKSVRQEARQYKKEGYYIALGALPIEQQLTVSYMRQKETNEQGYPKFFFGNAKAVGETQIAAKLQAIEAAKLIMAGNIASDIAALIENNIANQQLNSEEAASVTKTVAAAKNIIAQQIGQIITLVEMYKNINKNSEANVFIAYSREMAMEMAKKVVREQLEDQTKILQDKLEKLMKF